MSTQQHDPRLDTILRYYHGCNTADVALMMSTFHEGVVHYFVDHAPVAGARELAGYWAKVGPRTRASWHVDHALVKGDEAVIEWSMVWTPADSDKPQTLRGTEWFVFVDDRISEIRSYHNNHHLQSPRNRELHGFPYAARGYPPTL